MLHGDRQIGRLLLGLKVCPRNRGHFNSKDGLTDGAGNDFFQFNTTTDSTSLAFDVIQDFVKGADKIDLSAIDANSLSAGNQAFTFNTSKPFFTSPGDLWVEQGRGFSSLYLDINGDRKAGMRIDVMGTMTLTATDFFVRFARARGLRQREPPARLERLALAQDAGGAQCRKQPVRGQLPARLNVGNAFAFGRDFFSGQRQHRGGFAALDHRDPVSVTHHQVTRENGDTAHRHGVVDAPAHALGRAVGTEACGKHRKAQCAQRQAVAGGTVDHGGVDAQRQTLLRHDFAHQRRAQITLAINDQHITGLGQGHGGVNHEVVAGAHFDSEGRACKSHAGR